MHPTVIEKGEGEPVRKTFREFGVRLEDFLFSGFCCVMSVRSSAANA